MSNKAQKRGLIPKLRFPEFRGAGAWEEKTLGEVITFQAGFPFESASFTEERDGLRLIRNRDLKSDDKIIFYSRSFDEKFVVNDGDVLVGMDGDFTPCVWGKGKALLNQRVGRILPHSNNSLRFLFYFLAAHLRAIEEVTARTTVKHLSHSDVERICEPLPALPEQQKIADCLASLDARITLEAQKLDTLKTHKKGLMQQLFPAEGETMPKLRFPEFRDAGEWEPRLLGEVVKSVKTGKLDANAMVENGQYRFYTCAKNHYQIDHYAFEGEALLIAGNGAYLGYIHHYVGKFNAYQRTYVLQNFETNVGFLKCLLDRYLPSRILLEKKDGNTPYIVLSTITEMPLLIPKNEDEQQKIADCLASLDDLITAQSQKLATLKTHKKGLLQQLFPVMDEVVA